MNGNESKENILKSINASLKSQKLYPIGHPAIAAPVKKTFEFLVSALKAKSNIMIGLVNETLLFEDTMVEEADRMYPDIKRYMLEKNVDAIIFERGLSEKEVVNMLGILGGNNGLTGETLQNELRVKGVAHITLKSIPIGKKNLMEIYNDAIEVVKNALSEVRLGKLPKAEPVNQAVKEITDSVFSDRNAIIGLTMIKNYDNYLFNHSVNVSILSLSLARELNLNESELHAVGVAGLLHDIGKTGVDEEILRKPGGLSSDEWNKMKEHPVMGSNITKSMTGMDELIGRIVYEHHMRYDHTGYPQTTSSLHPFSQIVTISDAYDALTTLRVYQKPHNPMEAAKVMTSLSGRHFNPETLKAFINMLGLYPVGTMVKLATGEVGIVVKIDEEVTGLPLIRVLYGADGDSINEPYDINLAESDDIKIVSTINPLATSMNIGKFFEKEASTREIELTAPK